MKKNYLATCLAVVCLAVFALPPVASARTHAPAQSRPAQSDDYFYGTRAELVAAAMPYMLANTGDNFRTASPSLSVALQRAFNGSNEFAWAYTLVKMGPQGAGFSLTLPSDVDTLKDGVVALGMIQNGRLARVFRLRMDLSQDSGSWSLSLSLPDGTALTRLALGEGGGVAPTDAQLMSLAAVMYPDVLAKGAFDPIIDTLEGILDMLYSIRDVINMALCAVYEAVEMMNEMNACPLNDIDLGTGDLAYAFVCLIGGVMAFVQEVPYCF